MTDWRLSTRVNLDSARNHRVESADARRQMATAREILSRLRHLPGQVLADEVGLGKTYTALAVAASVAIENPHSGPVVVMVPPALTEKWPKEWAVFADYCLSGEPFRVARADRAVDFLKLLDDAPRDQARLIFLRNGAFGRQLRDPWVKLAVVRHAVLRRGEMDQARRAIAKWGAQVVGEHSLDRRNPELVSELLAAPLSQWKRVANRSGLHWIDDDPVPKALAASLGELDLDPVRQALSELPQRQSPKAHEKLRTAARRVDDAIARFWKLWLAAAEFASPLLVLDEAHHTKNPHTQLSRLFLNEDEGGGESPGALYARFERMLFLTATPFQLGHHELMQILDRFSGVSWASVPMNEPGFRGQVDELSRRLGVTQSQMARLDEAWARLRSADVAELPDGWWRLAESELPALPESVARVRRVLREAQKSKARTESLLGEWVIRHRRPHERPSGGPRRTVRCGAEILGPARPNGGGIEIDRGTLLPFLLAGRAQVAFRAAQRTGVIPGRARALFADGICSSFEAYVDTRRGLAIDDELRGETVANREVDWYVRSIMAAIPRRDQTARASHPKIAATVDRVRELWLQGEKVVVFCHFRATGAALRRHISRAIEAELKRNAARTFGIRGSEVQRTVRLMGDRLHRRGEGSSPLRVAAEGELRPILVRAARCNDGERERLMDTMLRFLRSPVVLARYGAPLHREGADAVGAMLDREGLGGSPLRVRFKHFVEYVDGLVDDERASLLIALDSIQTGAYYTEQSELDEEGVDDRERLIPTVRLANGSVSQVARQRLMHAFNSPLLPEVLIASQVLAEGVDLHHDCRHVIHHDLDWNPSTLEQRTGRVDRLGSQAERFDQPIAVDLPYLAKTQDEKMYRVVRDRERWFQVVMGAKHELDEAALDAVAERVELPAEAAQELAFRLECVPS